MDSLLDSDEFASRLFYPRKTQRASWPGSHDHFLDVDQDVKLHCREYVSDVALANILLFHGNGETVQDYNGLSANFVQLGVNLWVVDFRGYGLSEGRPTLGSLLTDSVKVLTQLQQLPTVRGSYPWIVMGRSLGSLCAAEIALHSPSAMAGYIVDSGIGSVESFIKRRGLLINQVSVADIQRVDPRKKLTNVLSPALVIHGSNDGIISPEEAKETHRNISSTDKTLAIVEGRGHNDLFFDGQYWSILSKFVSRVGSISK